MRETLNQHQRRLVKESSVRRRESIEEEFGQGKALSQVYPSFGGGQNFWLREKTITPAKTLWQKTSSLSLGPLAPSDFSLMLIGKVRSVIASLRPG